jgi:hypothetical protein
VDRHHALQHLYELRARVTFLRAMRPDSQSYKLWIGDIAEFANTVWGTGAAQLQQLASALRQRPDEDDAGEVARYLRRLNRVDAVLADFERQIAAPAPGGQE